jgi:pilus assembly protein CpaF
VIITVQQQGAEPRTFTISGSEALIGKHADCQVVLSDTKVSRHHARLRERDGAVFVEDLDSTNGTRVAGRAVEGERPLADGEEIEIGPFRLSVSVSRPEPAVPKVAPATLISGLGPLERFLGDDSISEIMVNGPDEVFIERKGRLELTDLRFESADAMREMIVKIAAEAGRSFDERRPLLDARLRDGSRVNAVLTPLAVRGPYLTIRRFPKERLNLAQLVANGSLSQSMLEFLRAAVLGRLSILVSGGTGSGKTTLLAALCGIIPPQERVVTVEDAAELRLPHPHVLPLESRPPDGSGEGEITIRDLVRNSLRMRPDRIVVGEVRGAEALDMLQAMNTGHQGSLSTVHANSPREALQRLETLVLFAGTELPQRAVREQIVGAIPLIVHIARLSDGRRRVTKIEELTGLEAGQFTMGEVFRFESGTQGSFQATGYVPRVRDRLAQSGITVDNGWFQTSKKK